MRYPSKAVESRRRTGIPEPDHAQSAERVRHGDRSAFEVLFRAYSVPLCAFALRYVTVPEVAEEIVQDVFLKIWVNRESWRPRNVKSYLYGAVRNKALDHLAHQKVVQEWKGNAYHALETATRTPQHTLQYEELAAAIHKGIECLPERTRLVFILSRQHGLRYKEIAAALGISVKTVEAQMSRAFRLLQTHLTPHLHVLLLLVLGLLVY